MEYILEHILQLPCSEVFNVDNLQGIYVQCSNWNTYLSTYTRREIFRVGNLQGIWNIYLSTYCSCLAVRCSMWTICRGHMWTAAQILECMHEHILQLPCRQVFHVDNLQGAYVYSCSDGMITYCSCLADRFCIYSICWTYVCAVVCTLPCTCMT